jgi:acyl carrier protein
MSPQELRSAFLDCLVAVAPDIDPATVGDNDHLQDDLELDSMDILNLVAALHKRFGVAIAESDYLQIATPGRAVKYLQQHTAA